MHVKCVIIDSVYSARDNNPPTDLSPNDNKHRSINNADYGSNAAGRSCGHRSKSQSPELKIINVTEGANPLNSLSSTTKKINKPLTRSALLIANYEAPLWDGTSPKIAVIKSLNNHGSSPASSHPKVTEVFRSQQAITDSLYNPRDVKQHKPYETVRRACVPDNHLNDSEDTTNAEFMASREYSVLPRST